MKNESVTEKRDFYIGGTDVKEILTQEFYTSVFHFAGSKLGVFSANYDRSNQYTKYGEIMEPILRDFINSETGTNFQPHCIIDEKRRFRGNLDGIDFDKKMILEIKTHGAEVDTKRYYDQIQFYLELSNFDCCVLMLYQRPESFYSGISYSINKSECYFDTTLHLDNITAKKIYRDKKYFKKIYPTIKKFQLSLDMLRNKPKMTKLEFNKLFYGKELVNQAEEMRVLQYKIKTYKSWQKKLEQLKQKVYKKFDNTGITKYAGDGFKIKKVEGSEISKIEVDINKLSNQLPDIFELYKVINTEKIEGTVRLTGK